jgi:hypothetical protein
MAVRVAPGAGDIAAELGGGFVVQVTGSSDEDTAARALNEARRAIVGLAGLELGAPGSPVVSNPVLAPGGPVLRVSQLAVDADLVATVPDLVAEALEAAGIDEATVEVVIPRGPLDDLDLCPSAVVLRVFPLPAGEAGVIPAAWVDVAAEWVLGELASDELVPLRLLGAPFQVPAAEAPAVVHHAVRARAWCDLVQGDLSDRIRTASITFGATPHLAIAAGGPGCDDEAILARYELLCEAAREIRGEVAYACIDIEPTFAELGAGLSPHGWRARGGAMPNVVAAELADTRIPDVFPYQLLGPRHLGRLLELRPESTSGERLADGRTEIMIGAPDDWFPWLDGRDEVREVGWIELAPLLVAETELPDLLAARPPRPTSPPGGAAAASGGQLDLAEVVLEDTPHPRRGMRLTLLELVAWLAHERHSDAPRTVSPVLAAYARWFSSALDDGRRQQLKHIARALIGTRPLATNGVGPLAPEDAERAWLATDWLLRAQAPAWFRAAGFEDAASALENLGPTDDPYEMRQALDIVAEMLARPDRLDPTGGHRADPTLAPRLVWDAWEIASEKGGWVAASEAAGYAVPPDVSYAIELRVIECARDPRVRDELTDGGRSMVDDARAAGWSAIAHQAWSAGLEAAIRTIDERSRLPWASAFDRASHAVMNRTGLDAEAFHAAVDAGDRAAHHALAEAGRRRAVGGAGDTVWNQMMDAARAAPDAAPWAEALDLAIEAVEAEPWEEGCYAAASVAEAILRDGPALIERAVGAAFAREASGFAARELAVQVAADMLGRGASEEATAAEILDAFEPTLDHLRDSALGLLEALIDAGTVADDDDGDEADDHPDLAGVDEPVDA